MKQNIVNPEKSTCKQTGERQGQTPKQSKELFNKTLDFIAVSIERLQQSQTELLADLADSKIALAEIRAELAKMRADSVAFRAGLTEIQAIIRTHNNRNFPHLQEGSVNQ